MKAEELRIGNIVMRKELGSNSPAYEIRIESILSDGINMEQVYEDVDVEAKFDDIEGIPLTEERLEKFGIGKGQNNGMYHFKKGSAEYLWLEDQGLKIFIHNCPLMAFPCRYVHQFQNFYFDFMRQPLNPNT